MIKCIDCPAEAAPDRTRCLRCLKANAARVYKRNQATRRPGKCRHCDNALGTTVWGRPSTSLCDEHLAYYRDAMRRVKAKQARARAQSSV